MSPGPREAKKIASLGGECGRSSSRLVKGDSAGGRAEDYRKIARSEGKVSGGTPPLLSLEGQRAADWLMLAKAYMERRIPLRCSLPDDFFHAGDGGARKPFSSKVRCNPPSLSSLTRIASAYWAGSEKKEPRVYCSDVIAPSVLSKITRWRHRQRPPDSPATRSGVSVRLWTSAVTTAIQLACQRDQALEPQRVQETEASPPTVELPPHVSRAAESRMKLGSERRLVVKCSLWR